MKQADARPRSPRKAALIVAALLFAGFLLWLFLPIQADLRRFDPDCVGDAEAKMWKHYYEPRHELLAVDVYRVARRAYGLSPFDSLRLTWNAARAATLFHGNNDGARRLAAEEHLRSYYEVIASHLGPVNAAAAARMELQWWRQHRSRQYGPCAVTLAALSAAVYGGEPERYATAAKRRVEAMVLCDARKNQPLSEVDWVSIRGLLVDSYRALREAVNWKAEGAAEGLAKQRKNGVAVVRE